MQLTNRPTAAYLLLYDGLPEPDGELFGKAMPVEGQWGRYVFEDELSKGCSAIHFVPVWEDGESDGELFSLQW